MNINTEVLEKFRNTNSSILVVTKYLDANETFEVLEFMEENCLPIFEWLWENRLSSLEEKELPKEKVHFIGNLQTKEIKKILDYSSIIHSVDNRKHILKLEEICFKKNMWAKIFLQINVDENKDGGITPEKIPEFLELIWEMENVSLVWFSCIWKDKFTREEKEKEFDLMIELRNKYIPNWLISAWTSVDYEIAIEKGIDIIRVGTKLFE